MSEDNGKMYKAFSEGVKAALELLKSPSIDRKSFGEKAEKVRKGLENQDFGSD